LDNQFETDAIAVTPQARRLSSRWLRLFQPSPAAAIALTDPKEIAEKYRRWQMRVLIFSIIGYATFYLVRKNLGFAKPIMEKQIGLNDLRFGVFLSAHGVLYGISKFANGFLADRANARVFMVSALIVSALLNLFFGFGTSLILLGLIWVANGWVQGMGFPPCARLMANWFPPKQLATKFSIWNTSHNIGSILVAVLCGYLVVINWRLCFFVPAIIALAIAALLWFRLPDTPPSVGLPEVEGTHMDSAGTKSPQQFKAFLMEKVFRNKYIWLVSFANFFVYTLRYAVFDWGPTILYKTKHIELINASWMIAGFEVFGLIGALLGGWITDRFLGGRAGRACVVYMALAGVSIFLFWKVPARSEWLTTGLLCSTGFFIYGPQCLLAVVAANLATKRAAATAIGLTSIFGYASTLLSGWGLGYSVTHYGWDAGFKVLLVCAAVGTLLFVAVWPAKANGYEDISNA